MEHLIKLGASPAKIVVGLPFYGRTFIAHGKGDYEDEADEAGFQGPYTKESGFMGYNEICMAIQNNTWQLSWDTRSAQAIAQQKDLEKIGTKVIVFDTSRSIANKVRFVVRQELGGLMVWSVDTDDFLGNCDFDLNTYKDFGNVENQKSYTNILKSRTNKNYPLLRTINEAVAISIEEWERDRDAENEIDSNDPDSASSLGTGLLLVFLSSFVAFNPLL